MFGGKSSITARYVVIGYFALDTLGWTTLDTVGVWSIERRVAWYRICVLYMNGRYTA